MASLKSTRLHSLAENVSLSSLHCFINIDALIVVNTTISRLQIHTIHSPGMISDQIKEYVSSLASDEFLGIDDLANYCGCSHGVLLRELVALENEGELHIEKRLSCCLLAHAQGDEHFHVCVYIKSAVK